MVSKTLLVLMLNTICVFSQPATMWEISNLERIATHINPGGEEIDNRYIEPNFGFGYSSVSVPGCPKSIEGNPWLYFGEPARCYLAGIQGPCPENQYLAYQRQSPFGICTSFVTPVFQNIPRNQCNGVYSRHLRRCLSSVRMTGDIIG